MKDSLADKRKKRELELPEENQVFLNAQNSFQAALIEALAHSYPDNFTIENEEVYEGLKPEERRPFKAALEFSPEYGASYKFLIRNNKELRDEIEELESTNPVSKKQGQSQEEYQALKKQYDENKKELVARVFETLNSEEMKLRNKTLRALISRGTNLSAERDYITEGYEEVFQKLLAAGTLTEEFFSNKEEVRRVFKEELEKMSALLN
jgi:hypothetical protein